MKELPHTTISHPAVDNEDNKAVSSQCRPTLLNMNYTNTVQLVDLGTKKMVHGLRLRQLMSIMQIDPDFAQESLCLKYCLELISALTAPSLNFK